MNQVSYNCKEIIDYEKIHKVLQCHNLPIDCEPIQMRNLKKILRNRDHGNYFNIDYRQNIKGTRDYGIYGTIQQCKRMVRAYLTGDLVYDFDIVNSHPTFLYNILKQNNLESKFLEGYLLDREGFIKKYRFEDKKTLMKILNNSNLSLEILDKIPEKLRKDIKKFHNLIYGKLIPLLYKKFKSFFKSIESYKNKTKEGQAKMKYNKLGVFISHYLQHEERKALFSAIGFMESKGYEIGGILFDGFHVGKSKVLYKGIFEDLNNHVLNETGYKIKFDVKQPDMSWKPEIYKGEQLRIREQERIKLVNKKNENITDIFDETDPEPGYDILKDNKYVDFIKVFNHSMNVEIKNFKPGDKFYLIKTDKCPFNNCSKKNINHMYVYQDSKLFGHCEKCCRKHEEIDITIETKYNLLEAYLNYETPVNLQDLITIKNLSQDYDLDLENEYNRYFITNHNDKKELISKLDGVIKVTKSKRYNRLVVDLKHDIKIDILYEKIPEADIKFRDSKKDFNNKIHLELKTHKCPICQINKPGIIKILYNVIIENCQCNIESKANFRYFGRFTTEIEDDNIISKNFGEDLLQLFRKGDILLQSGMGTAKTENCTKYVREKINQNPNIRILYITYRQNLARKHDYELKEHDFKLYLDEDDKNINADRLVICWNSLPRLKNLNYDIIITDEIDSILSSIPGSNKLFRATNYSEGANYIDRYEKAFSNFCRVIKNCKKFVGLDGKALTERTVNFIRKLRPNVRLIKNTYIRKTNKKAKIIVGADTDIALNHMVSLSQKNKKFAVCCSTKIDAENIHLSLKNQTNLIGRIYTGETNANKENIEDILNVNAEWCKLDYVVYTSAIPSAISFTTLHFHCVFSISRINSGTSKCNDMMQQISRIRQLIDGDIFIYESTHILFDKNYNKKYLMDRELVKYTVHNSNPDEQYIPNNLINLNRPYGYPESFNTDDLYTNMYFDCMVQDSKSLIEPVRYYRTELQRYYNIPTTYKIYNIIKITDIEEEEPIKFDEIFDEIFKIMENTEELAKIKCKPINDLDEIEICVLNACDFFIQTGLDKNKVKDFTEGHETFTEFMLPGNYKPFVRTIKRIIMSDEKINQFEINNREETKNTSSIKTLEYQYKFKTVLFEQIRREFDKLFPNNISYKYQECLYKFKQILKTRKIKYITLLNYFNMNKYTYQYRSLNPIKLTYLFNKLLKEGYNTSCDLAKLKENSIYLDTSFYNNIKECKCEEELYFTNEFEYYDSDDDVDFIV